MKQWARAAAGRHKERIAVGIVFTPTKFIALEYPFGVLGGTPHRISGNGSDLWIVPVILTSPGYGPVGLAGMVAVDAQTGKVVASTPRTQVAAEGKRLRQEKGHALETAFLQTTAEATKTALTVTSKSLACLA